MKSGQIGKILPHHTASRHCTYFAHLVFFSTWKSCSSDHVWAKIILMGENLVISLKNKKPQYTVKALKMAKMLLFGPKVS